MRPPVLTIKFPYRVPVPVLSDFAHSLTMASGGHFVGEPVYTPVVQAQNKLISDSMSISAAVAFIPLRPESSHHHLQLDWHPAPPRQRIDMPGDGTDDDAPADGMKETTPQVTAQMTMRQQTWKAKEITPC